MAGNELQGVSGSESDFSGSRSRSATPATAPTPGFILEHHDPSSRGSQRTGSATGRSRSNTPHSPNSGINSRSPSGVSRSNSGSRSRSVTPNSRRSGSVDSHHSNASGRSRASQQSRHSKQSGARSRKESHSPTPSRKSVNGEKGEQTPNDDDSRSQSPNLQIDDRANSESRSRSHSRSPSSRDSKSAFSSKRRSGSRSRSGSRKSRSTSRSRSRTRSHTHSRSGTRSRSATPHTRKSGSGSESGSEFAGDSFTTKKRKTASSGSGSEQEEPKDDDLATKAKKSRLIDSESEEEQPQVKTIDAQDIFGDADDISVSDEDKSNIASDHETRKSRSRSKSKTHSRSASSTHSRSKSRSKSRSRSREVVDQQEKEDEPEPIPETRIDVEIPRIVTDLGKEIHFVKLPNFLSVDTRPFDAETYEDEIDEEETMDEEGRQRIKLKVSNTIRWRELMNNKGEMVKESNARFIRWSDGSLSLNLGNETFDVYRQPLHGDHNHMFIRQGTGLQGQAVFRTKLTFRPHSTESFTHKKMTMSLADRSQKTSGIKILTQVGKDPTTDRLYNLKKEEEKLKQAMRSQNKPQPKKKKAGGVHDVGGGANSYHNDDGSDDENAISLSAIKNKYKKGGTAAPSTPSTSTMAENKSATIYSSDEDDGSDFEARRSKRKDKSKTIKALRDSDSESDADAGNGKNNNTDEGSAEEDAQTKHGSASGED